MVKAIDRSSQTSKSANYLLDVMDYVWSFRDYMFFLGSISDMANFAQTSKVFYKRFLGWMRALLTRAAQLGVDPSEIAKYYGFDPFNVSPPGLTFRRVELGAGPMLSAVALWHKCTCTAFTEFRGLRSLFLDYGIMMCMNIFSIYDQKGGEDNQMKGGEGNMILLGVDATQLVKSKFKADFLQFTNPNIGNQDVSDDIHNLIKAAALATQQNCMRLCVRSGQQYFVLDLNKLPTDWKVALDNKASNASKVYGRFKQTAFVISLCRNVNLMSRFFRNAMHALTEGGQVELVVSNQYVQRWKILEIAAMWGWDFVRKKKHVLEFNHMQTQESKGVHRKEGDHVKLDFKFSGESLEDRTSDLYEAILKEPNHLIGKVCLQKPSGIPCIIMGWTWD